MLPVTDNPIDKIKTFDSGLKQSQCARIRQETFPDQLLLRKGNSLALCSTRSVDWFY
jgi:hypothetical protein